MANTDSKNFRCDPAVWDEAQDKAADMRQLGYDIDVTKVLNAEVARFVAETTEETEARLGLTQGDKPAPMYRRPARRPA